MATLRTSSIFCIRLSSLSICQTCFLQLTLITSLLVLQVTGNSPPQPGTFETTLVWPEDTEIGTVIGNITAFDTDGQDLTFMTDTEDTNALVSLSEVRDVPNQIFKVVDIILKSVLDRDFAPRERKLYFLISDGSSDIPVWITLFISDVNDVAPQFVNLPYEVTIKENISPGSVIFSGVSAKDPDNGRSLLYTMESNAQAADDEYLTTFEINQYTGNITLKRQLDYEKHSYYQFRIMAEDDGNLKADPAGFVVYVLDVQDSPPKFVNLPYSTQINEDTAVGESIQMVVAVDSDTGSPNNITYSFKSGDFENFEINSNTGVITIKTALDRDSDTMRNTGGVYAMIVKAEEVVPVGQINSGQTNATTLVTITVKDVNDNAPTFSQQNYIATILENMQQGVPVGFQGNIMRVSDIDQGTNSHFSLSLEKDGQPYYDFAPLPQEIYSESSVLIRVNNSEVLDYETNQRLVFQVVARELDTVEKRSSTSTVTIDIEDMNDNAPVFAQTEFTLEIDENVGVDTSVEQYIATDDDSGIYKSIEYSLRGGNGRFRIESDTGILRVAGNIDREEYEQFFLTVEAKDGGGLRTPAEIVVTVNDLNDNSPVFRRGDYDGIVREESVKFVRPLKVEAEDDDKANTPNSQVSYRIAKAPTGLSNNFTIDAVTGVISLTQPLDFERLDPDLKGLLTLTVEAYDSGSPVMSSQVFANITVEDINDFDPVFEQNEYSTTMPENSLEGYVVKTVKAKDSDGTSPNNDFIYRIESGALDKFRINFQTGDVEVDKGADLDRESRDEYILTLSAIDRGTPPLIGYCTLKIKLTDVNDETPVFQPVSRSQTVNENTQKSSPVILFSATDPDINSTLEYSLGNIYAFNTERIDESLDVDATGVVNYFGIIPATGEVIIKNPLDRETADKVILDILVKDTLADTGAQTATGTLTVEITDYNDNAPEFLPSSPYKVNVSEADSLLSIVLQVSTTDADKGQIISYSIGTATEDAFTISSDGTVRLKQELDRERNERVQFEVIARDNGSPQLMTTATVSVLVLDDNDNSPVFEAHDVSFQVLENESIGHVLTKFSATDKDINDFGTVFYSFGGPDSDDGSFVIDETSGEITVGKELDREVKDVYRYEVVASDSKLNANDRKSERAAITITITDVDDNPPIFEEVNPESPSISESSSRDQTIATVKATDADDSSTDNGRIIFSLTDDTNATFDNGSPLFTIGPATGIITAVTTLDGHTGFFFITVMATNVAQKFKTEKEIIIQIIDVNDDIPRFVKPSIDNAVAYVLENSETGTSVFDLEARDDDSGPNGEISYFLIPLPNSDRDGSSVFQVDKTSGLITTKGEVNAEDQNRYELKIEARDQGFPTPYSTSLTMIIVVLDKNDHKPEFEGYTVPHQVSMEENKTSACANVSLAIDKDLNTTLTMICYYLIGSSLMNTFVLDTQTGMLCLNTTLDREVTPYVDIVIQALEECYLSDITTEKIEPLQNGEMYPSMYRPTYTDKLWIEIKVEDINDNPPNFRTKDLALGVTRVTQFGKLILDLKGDVEDKDSVKWGVDKFVATSNFTAHPETLKKELTELGVKEPFKLFPNGSVKTNMYFKPEMSGYFTVDLKVFDKGNLSDTAKLRISLINDNQRLIIIFRQPVNNVGAIKDKVASRLSAKVGYRIVVDSIQTHETETGTADLAKTDMYIHGEDFKTNEVIPAARLLSLIDQKNAMLIDFLNDYYVIGIVPTEKQESDDGTENQLKMALILVSVVLGSICIILAVVLYYVYKRYQRKLKAATAMAYEPNDNDLYKADIPGTNIHSYENANPIFLEKIMLDSQEDGLNSLDDNAYVSESTFDEQEITMDIASEDLGSKVRMSSKSEMYLSAVISQHVAEVAGAAGSSTSNKDAGDNDNVDNDNSRRDSGIEERSAGNSGTSEKQEYSPYDHVILQLKDNSGKKGETTSTDVNKTSSMKNGHLVVSFKDSIDDNDGTEIRLDSPGIMKRPVSQTSIRSMKSDNNGFPGHSLRQTTSTDFRSEPQPLPRRSAYEYPSAYSDFRNGLYGGQEENSV